MKKFLSLVSLLALTLSSMNAAKLEITKVEPANWYVGMKNPVLQIMLSGSGIREADVTTQYPGVSIDSLVRLDSPNYLLVYANVANAKAGTMVLNVKVGKKKTVVKYPLCERTMASANRRGFTNADVLYMLMPDRFAQGHADNSKVKTNTAYVIDRTAPSLRHGGDLEGIRQHLDYFTDLGVTALWFTPVLENDSPDHGKTSTYHGYATTDYYRIDPRFGTNAEYKQLIDEGHGKGLKFVMDMIFNHCGFEHPWIKDMPSNDWFNTPEWLSAPKTQPAKEVEGQSTTYSGGTNDLYLQTSYKLTTVVDPYASDVDLKETVDGWFVPSMPDLNQRNPHVMRYLIQNSEWWIEQFNIDGIRMDTYPYADAKGMALWMKELNEEYPNFNVVGESWVTEPAFTAALQRGSGFNQNVLTTDGKVAKAFDGKELKEGGSYLNTVMDFSFFDRVNKAKSQDTDAWWEGYNNVYNGFVYDYLYADPKNVLAFLDNHDTDRFLGEGQDSLALKQGLALLLTINRIPQIYYGTEIMMNGTKAITDGYVRKDFPGGFPGDERNAFTKEGRSKAENSMYNWLKKVLHWRQGNDVIIKGTQKQFIPYNGVYVMHHEYAGKHVLVVLNGTKKAAKLENKRYAECIPAGTIAREITSGRKYDLGPDNSLSLSPRQTLILEY